MKVLVLSGRFGMGHEMAANAICEQFRKIDEQAEIEKKDLLEELYPHISKFIFGGFRMMVEHCYGIYNFIYKMFASPSARSLKKTVDCASNSF